MIEIKKLERGPVPIGAYTLDRQLTERQNGMQGQQNGIQMGSVNQLAGINHIGSGSQMSSVTQLSTLKENQDQVRTLRQSDIRQSETRQSDRQVARNKKGGVPPLSASNERYEPLANPHTQSLQSRNISDLAGSAASTLQRPVPPPPPSREGTLSRLDGTATPPRPSEETNGVSLITPHEPELYTQEEEKWWWVCCLEFCFCLL